MDDNATPPLDTQSDETYRQWVPGVDASVWPQMKLARALAHVNELDARLAAWMASHPYSVKPIIDDDRLGWELRLSVDHEPAVLEWSLLAGDAAHALRSALDACVFDFATMDSRKPSKPSDIKFPFLTHPNEWPNARAKYLETVPEAIADRIGAVQQYQHADGKLSLLTLIQWLDNEDKHRAAIHIGVTAVRFQHNTSVKFTSDQAASRNVEPLTTFPDRTVADGAVLLRQVMTEPIELVHGGFDIEATMNLRGRVSDEPVLMILRHCLSYVGETLQYIYGGPPPAENEAELQPGDDA